MNIKSFLTLISLAGLALVAACTSDYNQHPANRLPPNPHTVKVQQAWSHDIGGGGGKQLLGLAPGAVEGEVVAAAAGGHVAAFDAESGKLRWSRHVKARLSAGPAVGGGLVVVGTRAGDVIALDAATGAQKWKHYVGAPVIASPAIGSSAVAVKTMAGALIGLSPATGDSVWESDEAPPSLSLRFDTQPLIVDGVVYAGFADGKAIAVDNATGKEAWRKQVAQGQGGNPVADLVDVGGIMAFAA
ncbi:MAG: PQQ-binding-like beta-propeller repeat protein, partial [Gammaproteobacteria bacterium]